MNKFTTNDNNLRETLQVLVVCPSPFSRQLRRETVRGRSKPVGRRGVSESANKVGMEPPRGMFGTKLSQTTGSTELTPHRPFWAPSLVSILVYQNARRGLPVGSLATRRLPSPFFTLSRHPDRVADRVSPQVNQTTCFASTPPSCTKVSL